MKRDSSAPARTVVVAQRWRPHPQRGLWAVLVGLLLALVLGTVYLGTLTPSWSEMDPEAVRGDGQYILWRASAMAFDAFPGLHPDLARALLSAGAGGACAGLLFVCVRMIVLLFCRGREVPARVRKRAAGLGAFVSVVAMSFSLPVWASSIRSGPEMFDLLLGLLASWLLISAIASSRSSSLGAFAMLYGLLLFEWGDPLRLAPLFALFLFSYLSSVSRRDTATLSTLVGLAAVGAMVYLLAVVLASQAGLVRFSGDMQARHQAMAAVRMHARMSLTGWINNTQNMPVLLVSIVPWMAGIALLSWTLGRGVPRGADVLVHTLLTAAVVVAFTNLPISPWTAARSPVVLPVTAYALSACLAGCLVAWSVVTSGGRLVAWTPPRRPVRRPADEDPAVEQASSAGYARFTAWAILALVLVMGVMNARAILHAA